jgi:hypothetical protein
MNQRYPSENTCIHTSGLKSWNHYEWMKKKSSPVKPLSIRKRKLSGNRFIRSPFSHGRAQKYLEYEKYPEAEKKKKISGKGLSEGKQFFGNLSWSPAACDVHKEKVFKNGL